MFARTEFWHFYISCLIFFKQDHQQKMILTKYRKGTQNIKVIQTRRLTLQENAEKFLGQILFLKSNQMSNRRICFGRTL